VDRDALGAEDLQRIARGVLDREVVDRERVAGDEDALCAGGLALKRQDRRVLAGAPDRHAVDIEREVALEPERPGPERDRAADRHLDHRGLDLDRARAGGQPEADTGHALAGSASPHAASRSGATTNREIIRIRRESRIGRTGQGQCSATAAQ